MEVQSGKLEKSTMDPMTDAMPLALIVDVDGTVAIRQGREAFEWSKLESDLPNTPVIEAINRIASTQVNLIFLTGREQRYHRRTSDWISQYVSHPFHLYCRADNDKRKDFVIKRELFSQHIEKHYRVLLVLDDRDSVVRMWREELNLTCLQVAFGDF